MNDVETPVGFLHDRVLEYLQYRVGWTVHVDEIAEATSGAASSVSFIMNVMVSLGYARIITRGNTWVWLGVPEQLHSEPIGKLYEHLATLKTGEALAQDEDGALYRLMRVEV